MWSLLRILYSVHFGGYGIYTRMVLKEPFGLFSSSDKDC